MSSSKTFLDDGASFDALINLLPADAREEYLSYACLASEAAFPGRKLIVYTIQDGKPGDVEFLTCGPMRMNGDNEFEVDIASDRGHCPFILSMVPIQVPGREVFFIFRRSSNSNGRRRLREAVLNSLRNMHF